MKHLYLEVTDRCNLRCVPCTVKKNPCKLNEPRFEKIVELLRGFKAIGGEYLTISGGEPGLRNDLPLLINEASILGYKITLFTNGEACSMPVLDSLSLAGGMLALSLDGPNEKLHEAIRGPGTFLPAIKALVRSVEALGSENVILSCLLSKPLLPELSGLWEFANQKGVGILYLCIFEPTRQGRNIPLAPKARELVEPVIQLLDLAEKQPSLRLAFSESDDLIRGQVIFSRRTPENILGKTIKVQADGWAIPGTFYYAPQFRLGRPYENGWMDILASPVLVTLLQHAEQKVSKTAACSECFWKDRCSGGSLALTWATYRTWYHPCPLCQLYNATLYRSGLKNIHRAFTINT